MKPITALFALLLPACASSQDTATGPSCSIERPEFGVATAAERDQFAYNADAPLNLQKTVQTTTNGVELSVISYDSPDGGRVTGIMTDPVARTDPRPGIVLMHGLPGTAAQMTGYAQGLAGDGAVVIAIDAPFARRSGQPVRFIDADRTEQIQLIKDLQRAVDVLRAHPNVDDARIAYHGTSYGGAMGALFVGIERRLKAAALVVPDGGLVSHFTGPEDEDFLSSMSCATRDAWFEAMTPIEPIRFIGNLAPGTALLVQNGRYDDLVPMADAEELHEAVPAGATILWYGAGHGLDQQAFFDRIDWLHEQVGLDPRP